MRSFDITSMCATVFLGQLYSTISMLSCYFSVYPSPPFIIRLPFPSLHDPPSKNHPIGASFNYAADNIPSVPTSTSQPYVVLYITVDVLHKIMDDDDIHHVHQ
jgi:hypothetical protein